MKKFARSNTVHPRWHLLHYSFAKVYIPIHKIDYGFLNFVIPTSEDIFLVNRERDHEMRAIGLRGRESGCQLIIYILQLDLRYDVLFRFGFQFGEAELRHVLPVISK